MGFLGVLCDHRLLKQSNKGNFRNRRVLCMDNVKLVQPVFALSLIFSRQLCLCHFAGVLAGGLWRWIVRMVPAPKSHRMTAPGPPSKFQATSTGPPVIGSQHAFPKTVSLVGPLLTQDSTLVLVCWPLGSGCCQRVENVQVGLAP